MKRFNHGLIVGLAVLLLAAVTFVGCENPEAADGLPGAPGKDGTNGNNGNNGKDFNGVVIVSATGIQAALDVNPYVVFAGTAISGDLTIPAGRTLEIAGDAVPDADTIINGTLKINTGASYTTGGGDIIVNSSLTVPKNTTLYITTGDALKVADGKTVTVNGNLIVEDTINGASETTPGVGIVATKIGNHTKNTTGETAGYKGTVTFASDTFFGVKTANIADGYPVHNKVSTDELATTSGAGTLPGTGNFTLKLRVSDVISADVILPARLTVIIPNGVTLAADNSSTYKISTAEEIIVEKGGTLESGTSSGSNFLAIVGTGKITAGAIVISGAGTIIGASSTVVTVANANGFGSLTVTDAKPLVIAGAEINAGNGAVVFKAGTYTAGGTNGKITITGTAADSATLTVDNGTQATAAAAVTVGTGSVAAEINIGAKGTIVAKGAGSTINPVSDGSAKGKLKVAIGAKIAVNGDATGATGTITNTGVPTKGSVATAVAWKATTSSLNWIPE
ncbi:hypothetical protein AGMMS49942_29320 [Spirochaetia bacterium]|nr:hypothetical protein AGMMS49942_29320 [Spirochaetia bacterium]